MMSLPSNQLKRLATTKHPSVPGAQSLVFLAIYLSPAAVSVPGAAHGGDRAPAAPGLRRPEIPAFSRVYPLLPQLLRHPYRLCRGS